MVTWYVEGYMPQAQDFSVTMSKPQYQQQAEISGPLHSSFGIQEKGLAGYLIYAKASLSVTPLIYPFAQPIVWRKLLP